MNIDEAKAYATPSKVDVDGDGFRLAIEIKDHFATIDKIYKDREEYDLKIKSDNLGYISGLSWFGRAKPNTIYKIYVEESK